MCLIDRQYWFSRFHMNRKSIWERKLYFILLVFFIFYFFVYIFYGSLISFPLLFFLFSFFIYFFNIYINDRVLTSKYLSILLIKDHEHKILTSQSIKFCKIIVICYKVRYKQNSYNKVLFMTFIFHWPMYKNS